MVTDRLQRVLNAAARAVSCGGGQTPQRRHMSVAAAADVKDAETIHQRIWIAAQRLRRTTPPNK